MMQLSSCGYGTKDQQGIAFVISGPSGVGKTSVIAELLKLDPSLSFSVSATTRPRRPDEVPGRDYFFVTEVEFDRMIASGELLEWTTYQGHRYGTLRREVEARLSAGQDVVLKLEVNGARNLASRLPFPVVLIFLMPPSWDELRRRIEARGTESASALKRRLQIAAEEMKAIPSFHYLVINDRLEDAVAKVQAIVAAERCRIVPWSG